MGEKMNRTPPVKRRASVIPKRDNAASLYGRKLLKRMKQLARAKKAGRAAVLAFTMITTSGPALSQSLNDVFQWMNVGGQQMGGFGPLSTTTIAEGTNKYYRDSLARASLSVLGPLSYNALTGQFSVTGLSGLGTANQIPGMNAGATGLEWKTLAGNAQIGVVFGAGSITLSIIAGSIGASHIGTGAVATDEVLNGTLLTEDAAAGFKAPLAGTADSAIQAAHAYRADSAGKTSHTGVTAGPYGTASSVFSATLSSEGRASAASNVPISITGANVQNQTLNQDDIDSTKLPTRTDVENRVTLQIPLSTDSVTYVVPAKFQPLGWVQAGYSDSRGAIPVPPFYYVKNSSTLVVKHQYAVGYDNAQVSVEFGK